MQTAAKKQYQNTTVRVPRRVYEQARSVIERGQASSFNEFVVEAIKEKVHRLTEAEIDAAFSQMAGDSNYQREAIAMATAFEKSDWEALQAPNETAAQRPAKKPARVPTHGRTAKTRSR